MPPGAHPKSLLLPCKSSRKYILSPATHIHAAHTHPPPQLSLRVSGTF